MPLLHALGLAVLTFGVGVLVGIVAVALCRPVRYECHTCGGWEVATLGVVPGEDSRSGRHCHSCGKLWYVPGRRDI